MNLRLHLTVLLLPLIVVASTSPDVVVVPVQSFRERALALSARQVDFGGLLGGLVDSIGPILGLITPENFERIDTVLHSAAYLLDDEGTKMIKNLINSADALLTPEIVDLISTLLEALGPIVENLGGILTTVIGLLFDPNFGSDSGPSGDDTPTDTSTDTSTDSSSDLTWTLPSDSNTDQAATTTYSGDIGGTTPTGGFDWTPEDFNSPSSTSPDSAIFTGAAGKGMVVPGASTAVFLLAAAVLSSL